MFRAQQAADVNGSNGDWDLHLITCAAEGSVTGCLAEWPYLAQALSRRGHVLPLDTEAECVIQLCRSILDVEAD